MLRRFTPMAAAALLALTAAGCASLNGKAYLDRGANFARYRTYSWAPSEEFETGDARLDNNPFFQDRVQAALDRGLAARGFEKADADADLVLHYHFSVKQRIDVTAVDKEKGYETNRRVDVYDAGTLVVDLVDRTSNRLVWRGWVDNVMEGAINDQRLMETTIDRAVARILNKLPPRG